MKLIDADALIEQLEEKIHHDWRYCDDHLPRETSINYEYLRGLLDMAPGLNWISMDDRPPKYEGFYLCHYQDVWDDGEDVATMYFNGESFGILGMSNKIKVLHWMPALWPGNDGEMTIYMSKNQYKKMFGLEGEEA